MGISTCPNDTFAFHALLNRKVDWRGLDFKIELLDIEQLNERLFSKVWDVAKASFHAALLLSNDTVVLPSGSALGFGVGPLLLASKPNQRPQESNQLTLCPGQHTTANLLFNLFYADTTKIEHRVFSEIMPTLQRDEADFGVCIHEGRFTWQEQGLYLVEDLGSRWENETNAPLPLGGILASRNLPQETLSIIQNVISDSLRYGMDHPEEALESMRKYAQEFDDQVLMQHVELYVNQWTLDLGEVGQEALKVLWERANSIGLVNSTSPPIQVWSK